MQHILVLLFVIDCFLFVQCLPWLQLSSLKSEEEERKERVKRLSLEKSASQGIGLGPAPKVQVMGGL